MDAVGYHPYVFNVSDWLMQPDTAALRTWMDANAQPPSKVECTGPGYPDK